MTALAYSGNVFSLDALRPARDRRQSRFSDRRREPRFVCRERLFLQVVLSPEDSRLVGRTVTARTVNVSPSGIQYLCDLALPVGTRVDLWVDISSRPGKFFLSGEICWCEPTESGPYAIGILLEEGPATDIASWRTLMS